MTLHLAWRAPETATWAGTRMVWVLREGAKTAQLHLAATTKEVQEPGVIAWQPVERPPVMAMKRRDPSWLDYPNGA